MPVSCQLSVTKRLAKRQEKPAILNVLTIPSDSVFPDWSVKHFRSLRNSRIIKRLSGISFTITMPHSGHPYYSSTTKIRYISKFHSETLRSVFPATQWIGIGAGWVGTATTIACPKYTWTP